MKYKYLLPITLTLLLILATVGTFASLAQIPLTVTPSSVYPGDNITIETEADATCYINNGQGVTTVNSGPTGRIILSIHSPIGTVISIYCESTTNGTSPTRTVTVVDPNPPTPIPGVQPTEPPAVEQSIIDVSYPAVICASGNNAAVRTDSNVDAPIFRYLTPNVAEYPVRALQINGLIWYQLSPNYFWVQAAQVTASSCATDIITDEGIPISDLLADCPDLISDVLDLPLELVFAELGSDTPCIDYDNMIYNINTFAPIPDPLSHESRVRLFDNINCQGAEALVIPGFVNVLDNVDDYDEREDIQNDIDETEIDPCDFANQLIQNHSISQVAFNILGAERSLELVVNSCISNRTETTVERITNGIMSIIADYPSHIINDDPDFKHGEICDLVDALVLVGDNDIPLLDQLDDQMDLYSTFTETCQWDEIAALEIVAYATSIAGNASIEQIVAEAEGDPNFCTIVIDSLTEFQFETEIFDSLVQVDEIRQIAGSLDLCATDDTSLLILVMGAWNRWDELDNPNDQLYLLTAPNSCELINNWILGIINPPFVASEVVLPPRTTTDARRRLRGNLDIIRTNRFNRHSPNHDTYQCDCILHCRSEWTNATSHHRKR